MNLTKLVTCAFTAALLAGCTGHFPAVELPRLAALLLCQLPVLPAAVSSRESSLKPRSTATQSRRERFGLM